MARYFFHLTGLYPVNDTEGEQFPNPEAAADAAREVAQDLARNRAPREAR